MNEAANQRTCIILAGGKSVRLGRDKIMEAVGGTSLLELVAARVQALVGEIIIVVGEERSLPELGRSGSTRTVADIHPGKGSLGGIYTGLAASKTFYNLIIAADMPFLNPSLLGYILEVSEGFDFVLPRIDSFFEPLHAVYSKNCIEPAELLLKQGKMVITELFNYVKVRHVEEEEIDRFDPRHLSFFNINTQEDLERARMIAGEFRDQRINRSGA
jgi:molybdopterin-guanine dinucleotide biosynthesis protein A